MKVAAKCTGKPSFPVFWIVLLSFIGSCSLFNGDDKEPINLEGTQWRLERIEAIDDSVFNEYPNGIWEVPEEQTYTLEFRDSGKVYGIDHCSHCGGDYSITNPDSISINFFCTADVVCHKNLEYQYRVLTTRTYKVNQKSLQLFYKSFFSGPIGEGILHFERMEEDDDN